jgi:hypothetical protein
MRFGTSRGSIIRDRDGPDAPPGRSLVFPGGEAILLVEFFYFGQATAYESDQR